jgi:hypothetical protein
VQGLLLNRGDVRPLPEWLPARFVIPALVVLAVVLEIVIGRALAR